METLAQKHFTQFLVDYFPRNAREAPPFHLHKDPHITIIQSTTLSQVVGQGVRVVEQKIQTSMTLVCYP